MIEFYSEGVEMPDINKKVIREWINRTTSLYNKKPGNISYIFVDDEGILKVNREFLNHDYYTDIITFDYTRRNTVSGDLYISVDTVRTNAEGLKIAYKDELNRVIIHGILHLCGINDKGPGEREIMESHENQALKILREINQVLPMNHL